jgi:hypothetical protein
MNVIYYGMIATPGHVCDGLYPVRSLSTFNLLPGPQVNLHMFGSENVTKLMTRGHVASNHTRGTFVRFFNALTSENNLQNIDFRQ